MIIIKLIGGLGNQLFEYSGGRSLSHDLNKELHLDLSHLNNSGLNHEIYGMHSYNIKGIIGGSSFLNLNKHLLNFIDLLHKIPFIKKIDFVNYIYTYIYNHSALSLNYIEEPSIFNFNYNLTEFNKKIQNVTEPTYIYGFFQFSIDSKNRVFVSDSYFDNNLDLIHDDLKYLAELTDESKEIVKEMNEYDSILLHVRHGDYTGLLDFGLCSREYYEKSMKLMASKLNNPKFFIFSDDIEGAKKLKIDYPHEFVDFDEKKELVGKGTGELLKLMSSCKHFIIANSTLSWWAAFLGENEDKIIITPKPWFQSRRIMGVKKIDNLKPISIANNHEAIFNNSKQNLYILNENEFELKHLNYEKIENSFKIKNINKNSEIILKNNSYNPKRFIIKIGLKSNHFNCLRILFKTNDNKEYSENVFNVYYYDEEEFEHYLLFPKNASLEELKIIPGHPNDNENDFVLINSLEIRGLDDKIKF